MGKKKQQETKKEESSGSDAQQAYAKWKNPDAKPNGKAGFRGGYLAAGGSNEEVNDAYGKWIGTIDGEPSAQQAFYAAFGLVHGEPTAPPVNDVTDDGDEAGQEMEH